MRAPTRWRAALLLARQPLLLALLLDQPGASRSRPRREGWSDGEADLADRIGRRQHRGDDEGDARSPICAFPSAPCEVSSPTRAISDVTTGSWKTRPKEKISVMIRLRYSDTFGSSEICTWPSAAGLLHGQEEPHHHRREEEIDQRRAHQEQDRRGDQERQEGGALVACRGRARRICRSARRSAGRR